MKNNLEYYQHYADADQHPKFKTLRVKYGWQGEGRFWALNNRIALCDNCTLDLSKERNRASIASDLGLSLTKFDEFILYLSSEACSLLTDLGGGLFTTDILQENLRKTNEIRDAGRVRQDKLRQRRLEEMKSNGVKEDNNAVTEQFPNPSNAVTDIQTKVKETKLNETTTTSSSEENFENFTMLEQHLLQAWGRDGNIGLVIKHDFVDLGKIFGRDKLFEAIKIAAQANVKNYRYVKAILEKQKKESLPAEQKGQAKENPFISVWCECKEGFDPIRRDVITKSPKGSLTCKKCGKRYSGIEILEKEKDGTADFINYENLGVMQ